VQHLRVHLGRRGKDEVRRVRTEEFVSLTTLVVTGSRFGHPHVERWLDEWCWRRGIPSRVFHGGARGVDAQVDRWCRRDGVEPRAFGADWDEGKGAGPARNKRMVSACPLAEGALLAFPDVASRGTWDCYLRAEAKGLPCFFAPAVRWERCSVSELQKPVMLTKEETAELLERYRATWRP
jgi:hypothetical protein